MSKWDQQTVHQHKKDNYLPFNSIYTTDFKKHQDRQAEYLHNVNVHP